MSSILRRSFLLAIATLVVWRVAVLGLSAHYTEQLKDGDVTAADRALAWNDRQPGALLAQANTVLQQDPGTAALLLGRAYAENPADAGPLMAMAKVLLRQGERTRADALVNAALRLTPSDPRIQQQAARYWASQDDLEKALRHWSLALEADPKARGRLFPILLAFAEDPRTASAFRPFAAESPSWWEPFFAEVAKRALEVEPVRVLFSFRRESGQVAESERKTYVSRLIREGMIRDAYIEWVNGLSAAQRGELGLLHDGGFELEPTNWGFDWHVRSTQKAVVDRAHTFGVEGSEGLHLLFDREDKRFANVYQPLFLDPGVYRLSGRVRTEGLDSLGGLKWTLRCLRPDAADLGESERFLGSNEWRDFGFEFEVPDACVLQELRLASAGTRAFEHKITGGAWFDRMAIRKLPAPEPAQRADGSGVATPSASTPSSKPPNGSMD